MNKLTPITALDMFEDALLESRGRLVLLFKHSRMCGISCEALDELRSHADRCAADVTYKVITVQSQRAVSDSVAKALGVRHETPQAILLKDGRPVWSASHFRITAAELDRVVASHARISAPAAGVERLQALAPEPAL